MQQNEANQTNSLYISILFLNKFVLVDHLPQNSMITICDADDGDVDDVELWQLWYKNAIPIFVTISCEKHFTQKQTNKQWNQSAFSWI